MADAKDLDDGPASPSAKPSVRAQRRRSQPPTRTSRERAPPHRRRRRCRGPTTPCARRAAPALAHSTTVALCLPPPPPAPPPLPAPARFQRRTRHRPRSAVGRLGSPASRRPLRPQRSPPCPRCNSSGVPLPLCRALPRSVRSARCARPLGPLYPLGRPHRPARPASTRLRRPTSVTSRRQACSKATTRRI